MLSSPVKPNPFLRNRKLRDASWRAVYDRMAADPSVHVFGEGASVKAHYDAPDIESRFSDRIHTLPISENGNTDFAIGAALGGVAPIIDVIAADFLYRTMDAICNTAAKLNFVSGRKHTIVIRAETLIGGPTTGQRPEALFAHIPGLRVVVPSTPRDAYGLMYTALTEPGVTLYFEDRMVSDEGPFTPADLAAGEPVPFGKLAGRQTGIRGTASIFTYGVMRQVVERVLSSQKWLEDVYSEPNLRADLYDLRTLYPLDWAGIEWALNRTGRLLVIEPDITYGGIGAELVAQVAERFPRVRVKRLGAPRTTIPASMALHDQVLPSEQQIFEAITQWS